MKSTFYEVSRLLPYHVCPGHSAHKASDSNRDRGTGQRTVDDSLQIAHARTIVVASAVGAPFLRPPRSRSDAESYGKIQSREGRNV